ncbi:MAG TPA: alpha/beta fold hydrolase [Burkholderiaceae bacterium]|nr:alpha/beta fold hydrolase [Burkholderiaceae bacterium]
MEQQGPSTVRRPGLVNLLLEGRAPFEYAASLVAAPWLLSAPRGDGHAVLVYPGLLASDFSTRPLRRLLRTLGHDARGWDQGRNNGARAGVLDQALQRLRAVRAETGRNVSLVGWSLGGLYARELAKEAPEIVRIVVSLGSPFTGPRDASNARRTYEWLQRGREQSHHRHEDLRIPPPVPTTSIYTRTDGIVAWQCSLETPGPMTENIEVHASHMGLGVNPLALYALADRLAQPEGAWQPFDRAGARRLLYPDPLRGSSAFER